MRGVLNAVNTEKAAIGGRNFQITILIIYKEVVMLKYLQYLSIILLSAAFILVIVRDNSSVQVSEFAIWTPFWTGIALSIACSFRKYLLQDR